MVWRLWVRISLTKEVSGELTFLTNCESPQTNRNKNCRVFRTSYGNFSGRAWLTYGALRSHQRHRKIYSLRILIVMASSEIFKLYQARRCFRRISTVRPLHNESHQEMCGVINCSMTARLLGSTIMKIMFTKLHESLRIELNRIFNFFY